MLVKIWCDRQEWLPHVSFQAGSGTPPLESVERRLPPEELPRTREGEFDEFPVVSQEGGVSGVSFEEVEEEPNGEGFGGKDLSGVAFGEEGLSEEKFVVEESSDDGFGDKEYFEEEVNEQDQGERDLVDVDFGEEEFSEEEFNGVELGEDNFSDDELGSKEFLPRVGQESSTDPSKRSPGGVEAGRKENKSSSQPSETHPGEKEPGSDKNKTSIQPAGRHPGEREPKNDENEPQPSPGQQVEEKEATEEEIKDAVTVIPRTELHEEEELLDQIRVVLFSCESTPVTIGEDALDTVDTLRPLPAVLCLLLTVSLVGLACLYCKGRRDRWGPGGRH